jgi:hypothetical protein
LVWDILLDFKRYAYWNQFCPVADVAKLAIDEPIVMRVDIGFGLSDQTEFFSRIEPEACIAWRMQNHPDDPIHAERVQTVNATSDSSCTYQSIDYFSGPGITAMIEQFGEGVRKGFNLCGQNLKAYAEQRYAQQQTAQA